MLYYMYNSKGGKMSINFNKIVEQYLSKDRDDFWSSSINQAFKTLPTPQAKGSVGVKFYKQYLESKGYEARIISNQGDIEWREDSKSPWNKDEVKTATTELKRINKNKLNEMIKEKIWVNQVRPAQKEWQGLVIIGIYPNHEKIWRMTRDEWDSNFETLDSVQRGMKHTGQLGKGNLEQVTLVKNSNRNNFHEWPLIYSSQKRGVL
jgi:hypothetical protein